MHENFVLSWVMQASSKTEEKGKCDQKEEIEIDTEFIFLTVMPFVTLLAI